MATAISTGNITVRATTLIDPNLETTGLVVGVGENLALLGGDITVEGGGLKASGGRIDLGAVESTGTIGLNADGSLVFPADAPRGDIVFTAARADVRTPERGGEIAITAQRISFTGRSRLQAGILTGQGSPESQAGDIGLDAAEQILVTESSIIENEVFANALGNAGNVVIATPLLEVLDGAQLQAITSGNGNAANVSITASDHITFNGGDALSSVGKGGIGNGGDIVITTPLLEVLDGAQLIANTFGQGDAGNVIIVASDRVTFRGTTGNGRFNSAAFSSVEEGGVGNGGDIVITPPLLEVLDGAQLIAKTFGQGDAGNVIITASDRVTFRGESRDGKFNSAAFSSVGEGGVGNGGDIEIATPFLEVLDGTQLIATTEGEGNAGNVIIKASDRVTFRGTTGNGRFNSGAFSRVEEEGIGNGDDIVITTPFLEVLDGAVLTASTLGQGDAGNVIITASDRVLLDGVGFNGFSGGLFSSTSSSATRRQGEVIVRTPYLRIASGAVIRAGTTTTQPGGEILIEATQVTAVGGGQVITTTSGSGRAGNITVNADRIDLSGRDLTLTQRIEEFGSEIPENEGDGESGLFANTRPNSRGNGGSITLNTSDLIVSNSARIVAQSEGSGNAGEVTIWARGDVSLSDRSGITSSSQSPGAAAGDTEITADEAIVLNNQAFISSDTNGGQGDIDLAARLLLLQDNSTITTKASGSATGGNIDIEADFIVAAPNENSDIFANALEGSGGQITLTALGIFGLEIRTRAELQQLLGDDPIDLTPRNLPSNDVTAFSQANPNLDVGAVTFRTPDVDPSRGLLELPVDLTDASQLIVQTCPTGNAATSQANEFTVTGRGGLPPTPSEAMNRPAIQVDLVTASTAADPFSSHHASPDQPPLSPEWSLASPIVEAQGFHASVDGAVSLVAAAPVHVAPSLNRQIHC